MFDIISDRKVAQVVLMARDLRRRDAELRAFVESMTDEEQAALVAIMWVGRGSFDAEDAAEAFETALSEATTPTADYLIGTPHLAENVENGLEAFGVSVSDLEDQLT